jgi:hypothetical protein
MKMFRYAAVLLLEPKETEINDLKMCLEKLEQTINSTKGNENENQT